VQRVIAPEQVMADRNQVVECACGCEEQNYECQDRDYAAMVVIDGRE